MRRIAIPFSVALLALALAAAPGSTSIARDIEQLPLVAGFVEARTEAERMLSPPGLVYYWGMRAEEAVVAWLTCGGPHSVQIQIWLEPIELSRWFAEPLNDDGHFGAEVVLDGIATRFWIELIEHSEMTGDYVPTLSVANHLPADFLHAFAAAATVVISTPAFDIPLSPAEGDPENRAAFVEACLAM